MKKKIILFVIIIMALLALLCVGLLFFKGKTSDEKNVDIIEESDSSSENPADFEQIDEIIVDIPIEYEEPMKAHARDLKPNN